MCYSVVMAEEAAISSFLAVTPLSPLLETGATLDEVSRCLKAAGAWRVWAIAVARG